MNDQLRIFWISCRDGINRSIFMVLFWVCCLIFFIMAACKGGANFIKDFGFPAAALLFTFGQLWFDRVKHEQERKDKYWDKRLEYYCELHKLVETIIIKFQNKDVMPQSEAEFKDTVMGMISVGLWELEGKGEILFNNSNVSIGPSVSHSITTIREKFKIIQKQAITLSASTENMSEEAFKARMKAFEIGQAAKTEIVAIFTECQKTIFSYLKV